MYNPKEDDSLDFSCFEEEKPAQRDYRYCETCNVLCIETGCELVCPGCGEERPWHYDFDFYSKNVEQNHNTSSNQFMNLIITGKNVRGIRNCLKMCGTDYYRQGELAIREALEKKIADQEMDIPVEIIDKTLETYSMIKRTDIVFRSQGKWYIIGACMNYAFLEAGIPKNRKEICSLIGISEKKLSAGENQLEKLNEMEVIHLPFKPASQREFINKYLEKLGIPNSFDNFITDLIDCAERQYLHIKNESRPFSRCIGSIYMLCQCKKEFANITKEVISAKCQISKTTFIRYYKLLEENILLLAAVFIAHDIPMKESWRPLIFEKKYKFQVNPRPLTKVLGF